VKREKNTCFASGSTFESDTFRIRNKVSLRQRKKKTIITCYSKDIGQNTLKGIL
jgi:hypothetical protein